MTLPFETARFEALMTLAADRFGRIEAAEEAVLRLSASAEDRYPPGSEDRTKVRAAFLRWLATDKDAAAHVDSLGLRVENATITSALDLDFCKITFRLRFLRCTLQDEIYLKSAELAALYLLDCKTESGINADGLHVKGSVFLRGLKAKGELRFLGAQIGGNFDCSGATLAAVGKALSVDGANITGDVFLNEGFSCSGAIRFPGAQIGGDFACSGAVLSAEGDALSADRAKITGGVFLNMGFSCSGAIRFLGTQIGGDLSCSDAKLTANGKALSADEANITGSVFLKGVACSGAIRFLGTRIGGNLDCSGAALTAKAEALAADGASITGDVFLRKGFSCSGEVRFLGARIGGDLDCAGATLTAEGDALSADRAEIAGGVFFREMFSCLGGIRLPGAEIGGSLECSSARVRRLMCEHMHLKGNLLWTAIQDPGVSYLNLLGASVNALRDDAASWPARGNLLVKGLEYRDLSHHEPSAEKRPGMNLLAPQRELNAGERISWLKLQGDKDRLDPQAWMWLARLFKDKDDVAGYRKIICEYRCIKARARRDPIARFTGVRMAHLERNPWLILWVFLPLLLLGTLVFWLAAHAGNMPPTAGDAYTAWATGKPFPVAYPRFNSLVYTLESELPLVRFGMDEKWAPDPNLASHSGNWTYWWLVSFRWFLIFAGWVQGILLTYGMTRRFRD